MGEGSPPSDTTKGASPPLCDLAYFKSRRKKYVVCIHEFEVDALAQILMSLISSLQLFHVCFMCSFYKFLFLLFIQPLL